MKKYNLTKVLVLVLSFALLIGSVLAFSAAAESAETTDGTFGGISLVYKDTVAITVEVKATEEQIKNGDVVVSYKLGDNTKNATYYCASENKEGYVQIITEGIAAYNFAETVTFSSSLKDGTVVEEGRDYTVAEFLYKHIYVYTTATEEMKALYKAIIEYGKAAQTAFGKNTDKDIANSTIVFSGNANVKFGTKSSAFAPAASVEVTPEWKGETAIGKKLVGWNIIDDGVPTSVKTLTFTAEGIVEVVSPVFEDEDPTIFTLANGGFENGLEGWTVVGNIGNVDTATHYWVNDPESAEGFAFGMDGERMFSAYAPGASEGAVGTLTSSSFIVGGTGYVTFKVGAMRDGNYVYVDVVDATTHKILERYYNGLWAERTDGVKSGCTLVSYKADLSEYLGKSVYFRISDNADAGYGLFFVDSFNTYHITVPGNEYNTATPVDYEVSGTIYDVFNGGFEYGDNRGWWNVGEPGAVTGADAFFSGVAYGKDGNFLYSGVEDYQAGNGREGNTGVLTSPAFQLGGSGYITYMLGGGNDLCYVQVIDAVTGEILGRYRQQAREDAVLKSYVANLSAHVGKTVRIQLVDKATSDWGCVSFDNVKTYYAEKPEGFIDAVDVKYEIVNGSFESGLNGWTQNITEAGAQNTLGWVESSEHDAGWYTKNDDRKDGNNLFTFCKPDGTNCENTKGTLNSSTFVLKKDSYIAFRFGGAGTRDVYVQLCNANGEVIATFYNEAEGKVNTEMYAYYYQYTGEVTECFFRVVDNSTSNYGCFVVDDFRVNLESAPEGFIAAIQ